MTRLVLLMAVVGASTASGQGTEAVTDDGRSVVLFDSGLWVSADSAWTGLRSGDRLESETGRFAVHVPDGWSVEEPTGEMLQGEFLLLRDMDSLYVSPVFVPVPDSSSIGMLALTLVTDVVTNFLLDGGPPDRVGIGPVQLGMLDGRLVIGRHFRGNGDEWDFRVATISATSGIVLVIGLAPPATKEMDWEEMLRRIEVVEPE